MILSSDKNSERNLSSFFDIKKPQEDRVKNPSPQTRILAELFSFLSYLSLQTSELNICNGRLVKTKFGFVENGLVGP